MALVAHDPSDSLLRALNARLNADAIVHVERLAGRGAVFGELDRPLPHWLGSQLTNLGIEALWSHQAEAVSLIRDRHSTVIATGTGSGKSLCYQIPIAEAVGDPIKPATALAIYPTKALAQDQLSSFSQLAPGNLIAATYDGDTDAATRNWVRQNANVVLTNPEMIHFGLLPFHERWATFFMRLRYVVIDELHVLRGMFGTHVGHLLRRLRRICESYGSSPTFVFSSATIGSPGQLASELCGLEVQEVSNDTSPKGERLVALVDPTLTDGPRAARSANQITTNLVAELVRSGHRTLAFCRSRAGSEVIAAEVVRRHPDLAGKVRSYRGGYLAAERREIEAQLFSGQLGGVIATNALELGIDVGGLDACVLNGFPGTIASMWQQIGRSGREGQPSLGVLVAGEDQLDRYYLEHPDELFTRKPERAVVNLANPYVVDPHLRCGAYEKPLSHHDEIWWGDNLEDGVHRLVLNDDLRLRSRGDRTRAFWAGRGRPSAGVGLRSAFGTEVRIAFDDGTLVGTVERSRACDLVHPGASYLHQGRPYRVVSLDLDDGAAIVEPDDGTEYTMARTTIELRITSVDKTAKVGELGSGLGTVEVTSAVTGYQRREVLTGKILGHEDLDLPPSELITRGYWWTIPQEILDSAGLNEQQIPGALHGTEHAAIGILPLFTICDRSDVGGVSTALLADTNAPTIVIYDGHPGGAGIAELGFEFATRQLQATLEVLERCRCKDGCPSCVQSPKCGNWNEPLDKRGAIALLLAANLPTQRSLWP